MENILRVEEGIFKKDEKDYNTYEGYMVVTDKQTIKIGISTGQSCCENSGYLTTNDTLDEFSGAKLLGIKIVDVALNSKKVEDIISGIDSGDTMFVNIETSNGLLQIVAYNQHNGYYGHNAVVISTQLNHEETL